MIKIRYRDADELSPGLHAAAVRHGRDTTVFLLPGLTAAERRAALRRLRLSARRGYCPPLPAAQLALALMRDRIRTTVGQVGTLVRAHPAGSTVPVMVISAGAIAFLALSAVSIQVLHRDPGRPSAQAGASGASPTGMPAPEPTRAQPTAQGGSGPAGPDAGQLPPTSPAATTSPHPFLSATSGSGPSPDTSATPSTGAANPTPSPEAAPSQTQPAASASASPAMQRPGSGQSSCLDTGPIDVCP